MSSIGDVNAAAAAAVKAASSESATQPPAEVTPPPLPPPDATWTDATTAALAAIADFFQKTRAGMREVKKAFDASRQRQMAKEVKAMREQADEIRTGALVQGVMLGASATAGAFALATSARTPETATNEPATTGAPATTGPAARPSDNLSAPATTGPATRPSNDVPANSNAPARTGPATGPTNDVPANPSAPATNGRTSEWFKWGGETAGKFSEPVKGIYDARAKECEADSAAARASGERAKTNAEDIQELADTHSELASKAMDAIRGVLEARHAAAMAVLARRA